jgi:hypothetical protein
VPCWPRSLAQSRSSLAPGKACLDDKMLFILQSVAETRLSSYIFRLSTNACAIRMTLFKVMHLLRSEPSLRCGASLCLTFTRRRFHANLSSSSRMQHALWEPDEALLEKLTRSFAARLRSDDNPAVRRGMALALGAMPRSLLCALPAAPPAGAAPVGAASRVGSRAVAASAPKTGSLLDDVIAALTAATRQERVPSRRDAETRRNAVMALAELACAVGFGPRERILLSVVRRSGEAATVTRLSNGRYLFKPFACYLKYHADIHLQTRPLLRLHSRGDSSASYTLA